MLLPGCYVSPNVGSRAACQLGKQDPKKAEKCTLVQVVPTLGTFWNFQAEAVLAGVGENKVLAFQHFS